MNKPRKTLSLNSKKRSQTKARPSAPTTNDEWVFSELDDKHLIAATHSTGLVVHLSAATGTVMDVKHLFNDWTPRTLRELCEQASRAYKRR